MPENSPPSLEYQIYDPERQEIRVVVIQPPRRRYWLHALLFLLTIFTTVCIGAKLQYNFDHNLGAYVDNSDLWPWLWIMEDWRRLLMGIPFSACLLGILTAHEFGHFIYCVRRGVYATLPFFIPAPTIIGTMGAFIRIRSPIRSRSDLFDIGIAGPIAGFIVAIPILLFSLLASKPYNGAPPVDSLVLGLPLIFNVAHWALAAMGSHFAAQVPLSGVYLHPTAIAAWFGMFATALNLIPGGQLDGGHIVFSLRPTWHRSVSRFFIAVLLVLSWFLWVGWLLWAIVLRITGERHPAVPLHPEVDTKRWWLGAFALLMLVLTFVPSPFPGASGREALKQWKEERQKTQQQTSPAPPMAYLLK